MASADAGDVEIGGGGAAVIDVGDDSALSDEISPLLADASNTPAKMTIFSVSHPRKKPLKEMTTGAAETEVDALNQMVSWVWGGSRYSGLLCAACSCTIYYFMEVLMFVFPVQQIPLFQTVFTRCTIITLLSFLWLRKAGQPLAVSSHVRKLLISRSLTGLISLLSFIYSVQNLPLPLAITLNFATPIMASIGAKIILQEKLALLNIGGLACSFVGLLLIFPPMHITAGNLNEAGHHPIFAILVGIFSSIFGGISHCLIRAGASASDHPVYTVLSFGLLAIPVSVICTFTFQEFVLPSMFTSFLMALLGVLSFFAEICLAHGLQLEKVGKVTNILYMKLLLSQIWSMGLLGVASSLSKIIGCLFILASVCSTVYLGQEKEIE